jgi:hypothetical protein
MEIKLRLEDALAAHKVLGTIIDNTELKIDVLLKFRLLSLKTYISPIVSNFEIVKNEKIIEYGKKNKDGSFQILPSDKTAVNKYTKALKETMNSTVTVVTEKIKPGEIFNKGITSDYLEVLLPFIGE